MRLKLAPHRTGGRREGMMAVDNAETEFNFRISVQIQNRFPVVSVYVREAPVVVCVWPAPPRSHAMLERSLHCARCSARARGVNFLKSLREHAGNNVRRFTDQLCTMLPKNSGVSQLMLRH